jgi:hypothetical protein
MKTAIFIFDNIQQVVLTPESDTDKRVCELIEKGTNGTMRGSVYECRGGWIRFSQSDMAHRVHSYNSGMEDKESLIVRIAAPEDKNA